jgi:hypothetical protein
LEKINLQNIKLSIVLASRGDFYGGDNTTKTAKAIRMIIRRMRILQQSKYEIVLVDYNYVENRKLVSFLPKNTLKWIKVVEISPAQASAFANNTAPFVEFHAKNIGIKNAHGAQILVINSDVKVSLKLLYSCLVRPYANASFLRADRTDIKVTSKFNFSLDLNTRGGDSMSDKTKINYREGRSFRVGSNSLHLERRFGKYIVSPSGGIQSHFVYGAHGNAAGDFICAPKWAWHSLKGYQEDRYLKFMGDSFLLCGFFQLGLMQVILPGAGRLLHFEHSRPIDHRRDWTDDDWLKFIQDFSQIASGKKRYKDVDAEWGS